MIRWYCKKVTVEKLTVFSYAAFFTFLFTKRVKHGKRVLRVFSFGGFAISTIAEVSYENNKCSLE